MTVHFSLGQTWSETPKTGFLISRLIQSNCIGRLSTMNHYHHILSMDNVKRKRHTLALHESYNGPCIKIPNDSSALSYFYKFDKDHFVRIMPGCLTPTYFHNFYIYVKVIYAGKEN